MKIVSLKRKGRSVFVEFSNSKTLKIPYDFFVNNYLSNNQELTKAQYQNYLNDVELYLIKQSAYRFLSGRNHSKFELRQKLLRKNYSKSLIEKVLTEFEQNNYLNDETFAEQFFNSQVKKKRGLLKVKSELYKKGVNREIVEQIAKANSGREEFLESAEQLALKKINSLSHKQLDKNKLKQRVYQYLIGRGFTPDIVSETIKKFIS